MSSKKQYRIAVIPGDGIGKEVMPEGLRILEAASKKYGFELRLDEFDFSSCDYYAKHGKNAFYHLETLNLPFPEFRFTWRRSNPIRKHLPNRECGIDNQITCTP